MSDPSEQARIITETIADITGLSADWERVETYVGTELAELRDRLEDTDRYIKKLMARMKELELRNRRLQSTMEYFQELRSLCEQAIEMSEAGVHQIREDGAVKIIDWVFQVRETVVTHE